MKLISEFANTTWFSDHKGGWDALEKHQEEAKQAPKKRRLRRAIVSPLLTIDLGFHVPQPNFGSLADLTPSKEEVFHHPRTLNPEIAKAVYRKAGIRLEYSPKALKAIREHRTVTFEYGPVGFVWVRPARDDSLRDMLDDETMKTYIVWSPYHDAYRLRQAGSLKFVKAAFEKQGIIVELSGFPFSERRRERMHLPRSVNITLYPFQTRAVDFIISSDGRACLFDEMGLGKTITATTALLQLVRERKASRALIVAPNAVVEQWRGELVQKFNLKPTLVTSKSPLTERCRSLRRPAGHLELRVASNGR